MNNSEQPAFPNFTDREDCQGLTKREYFSSEISPAIMNRLFAINGKVDINQWASLCVKHADALLLELQKQPTS